MAETESDRLHKVKEQIARQPGPETDDITPGDEAQKRRDKMQRQEKAEGDR